MVKNIPLYQIHDKVMILSIPGLDGKINNIKTNLNGNIIYEVIIGIGMHVWFREEVLQPYIEPPPKPIDIPVPYNPS